MYVCMSTCQISYIYIDYKRAFRSIEIHIYLCMCARNFDLPLVGICIYAYAHTHTQTHKHIYDYDLFNFVLKTPKDDSKSSELATCLVLSFAYILLIPLSHFHPCCHCHFLFFLRNLTFTLVFDKRHFFTDLAVKGYLHMYTYVHTRMYAYLAVCSFLLLLYTLTLFVEQNICCLILIS